MPAKKAVPVAKATGREAAAFKAAASPVRIRKVAVPRFPAPPPPPAAGGYTLGTKGGSDSLFDLTVPSGATCQVRRPGVHGLIKAGILDSMDSLTALVQTEHIDRANVGARKAAEAKAVGKFAGDMSQVSAGIELIDVLCCYVVVQPALYRPADYEKDGKHFGEEIPAGAVSVLDTDIIDRMFILQWAVGGTTDLSAFRKELGSVLDDIPSLQNISL